MEEVEGQSISSIGDSSSSSSSDLFGSDKEEEEVEEVNQGEMALLVLDAFAHALALIEPIWANSSDEKVFDPIFPLVLPSVGDEIDHSFVGSEDGNSSSEVDMPEKANNLGDALAPKKAEPTILLVHPKAQGEGTRSGSFQKTKRGRGEAASLASTLTPTEALEPWNPKFTATELKGFSGHRRFVGDASLQRAKVNSDMLKKHSVELKKAKKKVNSLEGDLKKAKEALTAVERAREASDDFGYEVPNRGLVTTILDRWPSYDRTYSWKVKLAYLKEVGTLVDHPSWTIATPEVVLPNPPEPYSLMILSPFNEEDYVNQAKWEAKGGNEVGGVWVGNKLRVGAGRSGAGAGARD
ncbi:hypothetical protein Acr_00g0011690 [Actinidia rufa]|uniref:Uncharacterized protein n=1 Tax=Actinidia rufa TaxID=165716 RepID=A0A7J0D9I4_9ERIC|nr:hypothetical protein Acr_00g0011690 [Actinidia rufa]